MLRILVAFLLFYKAETKKNFVIKHDHIELGEVNKNLFTNMGVETTKDKKFGGFSRLLEEVNKDWNVKVVINKLKGNDYKPLPVRFASNLCQSIEKNSFGVMRLTKNNGNYTKCPIKPGSYYVSNFVPDEDGFPPIMPPGKYKVTLNILKDKTMGFQIIWFGDVLKP